MKHSLKSFAVLCLVSLAVASLFAAVPAQPFERSRADVVEQFKGNISLAPDVATSHADADSLLRRIKSEVDGIADSVLPAILQASSIDAMECATRFPIVIKYSDKDYYRLLLRIYLMNIPARLAFLEQFPPMTTEQKEVMKMQVHQLIHDAKSILQRRLVMQLGFLDDEIADAASRVEESLMRRIGSDPFSVQLAHPLSDADTKSIVDDFDIRVGQSLARIQDNLSRKRENVAPEEQQRVERKRTLDELLTTLCSVYAKRSSVSLGKKFDLETVQPGLTELGRRLSLLEARLRHNAHPATQDSDGKLGSPIKADKAQ